MSLIDKTHVGKKGEILPKRRFREMIGIKPGDPILIEVRNNELVIRKIMSIDEIFSLPIIAKGSAESIEKELEEESLRQEEISD